VFTVSIIEGGTMHHTTDLANSDRTDLARSAVGAFLANDLRRESAPGGPISAFVDLVADVLHLANRLGFGPSESSRLAQEHSYAEILEER
jgi:hypothetical protein